MGSITRTKPTILIVPGAWHTWDLYSPMTEILQREGYKCVGLNLPSVTWSLNGSSIPQEPTIKDAEAVRSKIEELVDAGEDVLVFMHSYGGIPGQMACKGLDKATRGQQGKQGGVVKMVFCCAFALPVGISLFEAVGSAVPAWWRWSHDGLVVSTVDQHQIFYSDLSPEDPKEAELLKHTIGSLLPVAVHSFYGKNQQSLVTEIPSMYIVCTKDNAIPLQGQEAMVQGMRESCAQKPNGWLEVETLESSHSPFLSMPLETANLVRKAGGETV